ncbi:MAG: UDP-N-acetylmuramate dehydrogenase [Gammaproteobacteria bacterium]|nr:UDP-N-acetylmuramate dehydrogenase [Gammaproteobacteria bacterium]
MRDPTPTAVIRDEPMARHTSWRVGGPADLYAEPADEAELAAFLASLPEATPVYFVGLGSNLLVRDGGVRGAVVATGALKRRLERVDDVHVTAGAGLPCALLARQCVRWQLGPAAFFAGIPGTVGGALAMNAGAFGGETWNHVESVETIDRRGERRTRARGEYRIGYRSVLPIQGGEEWFLAATFRFEHDESLDKSAIKAMLDRRAASQPTGVASCGSVFRNPPGAYAGELIERVGLKGTKLGGAMVSDKHANFIVNTGSATAEDIETLIESVRRRVREETGIELELEARVIGEHLRGRQ